MSVITALARAVKAKGEAIGPAVWFEDELPNRSKSYPQVIVDARFSVAQANKEAYRENTTAYVSLWYQHGSIAEAKAADDLALEICKATYRIVQDDVYIVSGDRDLIVDDSGLARWRIRYDLTPL